jgi:hypothetical protein
MLFNINHQYCLYIVDVHLCLQLTLQCLHTRDSAQALDTAGMKERDVAVAWPAEAVDPLLCFLLHTCDVANQARHRFPPLPLSSPPSIDLDSARTLWTIFCRTPRREYRYAKNRILPRHKCCQQNESQVQPTNFVGRIGRSHMHGQVCVIFACNLTLR